jgi:hypothetical protein
MTQLTDSTIEDQINAAIANQPEIDAVEPRANKVIFDDGFFIISLITVQYFLFYLNQ